MGLLACCGPKPVNDGGDGGINLQKRLVVPFHFQEDSNLCWAAGVDMITHYPPPSTNRVAQCRQVTDTWAAAGGTGPADCCHPKPTDNCNITGQPRFDRYGYRYKRGKPGCHLSWQQIKAEIDADRPFLYDYVTPGRKSAHLEVVAGYQEFDGQQTLFAYDPNAGVKIEWFDNYFVKGPDWTHQVDHYEIQYDPPNQGLTEVACQ